MPHRIFWSVAAGLAFGFGVLLVPANGVTQGAMPELDGGPNKGVARDAARDVAKDAFRGMPPVVKPRTRPVFGAPERGAAPKPRFRPAPGRAAHRTDTIPVPTPPPGPPIGQARMGQVDISTTDTRAPRPAPRPAQSARDDAWDREALRSDRDRRARHARRIKRRARVHNPAPGRNTHVFQRVEYTLPPRHGLTRVMVETRPGVFVPVWRRVQIQRRHVVIELRPLDFDMPR